LCSALFCVFTMKTNLPLPLRPTVVSNGGDGNEQTSISFSVSADNRCLHCRDFYDTNASAMMEHFLSRHVNHGRAAYEYGQLTVYCGLCQATFTGMNELDQHTQVYHLGHVLVSTRKFASPSASAGSQDGAPEVRENQMPHEGPPMKKRPRQHEPLAPPPQPNKPILNACRESSSDEEDDQRTDQQHLAKALDAEKKMTAIAAKFNIDF